MQWFIFFLQNIKVSLLSQGWKLQYIGCGVSKTTSRCYRLKLQGHNGWVGCKSLAELALRPVEKLAELMGGHKAARTLRDFLDAKYPTLLWDYLNNLFVQKGAIHLFKSSVVSILHHWIMMAIHCRKLENDPLSYLIFLLLVVQSVVI